MTSRSATTLAVTAVATIVGLGGCGMLDAPAGDGATTSSATTPTTPPKPIVVVQTTPETAMASWLKALAAGDGTSLCNLMARGTKPYSAIPGATASCATALKPKMAAFAEFRDRFSTLTITGATVTGATATFIDARADPAMAEQVIVQFDAVKVQGKWYLVPATAESTGSGTGTANPTATAPATRTALPTGKATTTP